MVGEILLAVAEELVVKNVEDWLDSVIFESSYDVDVRLMSNCDSGNES